MTTRHATGGFGWWTATTRSEPTTRYQHTLDRTDDPELVAEAACRAGEILHRRGERSAARPLLERAAATGAADFAERAAALLR